MQIGMLGPFQVRAEDGVLADVPGARLRAVLVALRLVTVVGVPTSALGDNGPGSFFGPFVSAPQASAVLVAYLAAFVAVAAWLLHRRDVA